MANNNIFDLVKELPPWVVLGLGLITGGLRAAWSFLYEHTIGYAITRVTLSLTVEDLEQRDAYLWLSSWVETHLRNRKVNSLLLRTRENEDSSDSGKPSKFEVIPEYGTYYLIYNRRLMLVEHTRESQPNSQQRRPTRSIRLQLWLSWDRNILLDILKEARIGYEQNRSKRVDYFRSDSYGDWIGSTIPPRPQDLGIPYRRGYLLSGPPGTGKSSLILALASHFELPIYAVPLRGSDTTAERLSALLANCRKPAAILLEDIDCLKVATSRKSNANDSLSMADVLNLIDGIGASEDRILFMTANNPEALDFALTRAGRVDRKFFIDYARDEELQLFHHRIAQYHPVPPWPEFRAALPPQTTIADAQALFLQPANQSGSAIC
jgi:chaperone BCS1